MAHASPIGPDPGGPKDVRVFTLGRFQVCLQGKPLHFEVRSQRKPLELLKVLIALGGEQVAEESLCDAIWPDTQGDHAHSTLASTLHRLRRLIGADAVLLRDRRLTLNPECCWVDTRAFADALEQTARAARTQDDAGAWTHLEQALALYRGPFLEGEFEPPDILPARERLHGMFLRHVREWGAHYLAQGRPERATVLYRRGLEADALAEELYQALMRLHLEQGQAAEGVAVYRRCHAMLQAGAGIAPAPETERLHEALLNARKSAAVQATPQEPIAPTPALAGLRLADPPSIAVLAFDNLSGDAGQEFFADGISETLITRLARIPDLLVIARSSTFAYKGRAVDVRQVARELGVRHVLEGSVLKSAQRIRVTAQLIEAETGRHVWADRYDRELQDLFAVLDEITLRVVTELEVQLRIGEHAHVIALGTNSVDALEHQLQARAAFMRLEQDSNLLARELSRKAAEIDSGFAWAMAQEGWTHMTDVLFEWSADRAESLRQAETLAQRALAADAQCQFAHTLLSRVHALHGRLDEAIAAGRRAIALSPNDAYPLSLASHLLVWAGQPEEALALIRKALRLQPYPDDMQLNFAADAYYFTGQREEAVAYYRRVLEREPGRPLALRTWHFLIATLVELGRGEEARAEVRRLLDRYPDFTIAATVRHIKTHPFQDFSFLERQVAALRAAGLPE